MAAGICASGIAVFVLNFNPAVTRLTQLLKETLRYRSEDTHFLSEYRTHSFYLAIFDLAMIVLVVAIDFLQTDAQTSTHPLCIFVYGSIPCVMVGTASTFV